MTDHRYDGALPRRLDDDEAARAARHEVLMDLLGAYADEELPPETASQLEAHLVGCARCRRELQVQVALRDRLAAESVEPAPPALRGRIAAATLALPSAPFAVPSRAAGEPAPAGTARREWRGWRARALAALVVVTGAAALGTWRATAGNDEIAISHPVAVAARVPLLHAAAVDYRRVVSSDLPGRARDLAAVREAVGMPVEPLPGRGLRLLAAWTTELEGEPAAVLAYRWNDRLIVQYIVAEQLYFRDPTLRSAAAEHLVLAARAGAEAVLAWPLADAGTMLVGDGSPSDLANALER